MAKNLLDAIIALKQQGHKITYLKRKDGGYVVTSIDGLKFSSRTREGNALIREMTGQVLPESFERRLREQSYKRRVEALPPEVEKMLRKTQRAWRKAIKEGASIKGRITTKRVRQRIREEGIESAKAVLLKNLKYTQGYAYEENVRFLAERIRDIVLPDVDDPEEIEKWQGLIDYILENKDTFREEWIEPINQTIYGAGAKLIPLKTKFEKISRIIGYTATY